MCFGVLFNRLIQVTKFGFFSKGFITFRSLFWGNFRIYCEVGVHLYSLTCGFPVSPTPLIEKTALFPLICIGILVENESTINVSVYFWILKSSPLVCYVSPYPMPSFFIIISM